MSREKPCFFWVNAFTDQPFRGNPAVVCLTKRSLSDSIMQNLAAEFGVSETVFVEYVNEHYSLRWFTPRLEVDLCGHATLAAASVLWAQKIVTDKRILFHSASGTLTAMRKGASVELDFPVIPVKQFPLPEEVRLALEVNPGFSGKAGEDLFIELCSEKEVACISPDFKLLESAWSKGIIVTAPGSGKHDFVSRYFAPGEGIPEDPVTGSAHCSLGWYWKRKLEKNTLHARQISSRGGDISLRVSTERVYISGEAVILCRGIISKDITSARKRESP